MEGRSSTESLPYLHRPMVRVPIPTVLDIVYGDTRPGTVVKQLATELQTIDARGTVYLAYPVFGGFEERLTFDAFLLTNTHAPLIFLVPETVPDHQDGEGWDHVMSRLYQAEAAVKAKLLTHKSLRRRSGLVVEPKGYLYVPSQSFVPPDAEESVVRPGELAQVLSATPPIDDDVYRPLAAAIQSVATIKPLKKRIEVSKTNSRGWTMKVIEREIANLDKWQQSAAIESPDSPQRIRGLAGSGKTIVLALKAAYLHARHPEWHIAVTFHTKSLYQQFRDLVRRFTYDQTRDEPDWGRLRILHSWGSSHEPGIYSTIAQASGWITESMSSAKARFGYRAMFEGICGELCDHLGSRPPLELFDAVLIDEAQDLPAEFFRLCYAATSHPKRIVWAFDELQNLSDKGSMPPAEILFGSKVDGSPNIPQLSNDEGSPRQDIFLPVCYRNPPQVLSVAHALGLGIYRQDGLAQFFGGSEIWEDVGYVITGGQFTPGSEVSISRRADSYPGYFDTLLDSDDVVQATAFANDHEQWVAIAESIRRNIVEDELEPDDILVVFPDPFSAKERAATLRSFLEQHGIESEVAGVTTSPDEFSTRGKVTLAGIYRAKGNEAPMVYVADCHSCSGGIDLIRKRNSLFTAITRARAWVRICGVGQAMTPILDEVQRVRTEGYRLRFIVPTAEQQKQLRRVHGERTQREKKRALEVTQAIESLTKGDFDLQHLPPEVLIALRAKLENK